MVESIICEKFVMEYSHVQFHHWQYVAVVVVLWHLALSALALSSSASVTALR